MPFAPCNKIKDKNTPNCSLCIWHNYPLNQNADSNSICVAQGYERTMHCYNSRLCKKLFQKI